MDRGQEKPLDCPNGYNCNQPGWVFECEAGTFATNDHLKCEDCSVGSYCQKGIQRTCNPGTLANSTGQEILRKNDNIELRRVLF